MQLTRETWSLGAKEHGYLEDTQEDNRQLLRNTDTLMFQGSRPLTGMLRARRNNVSKSRASLSAYVPSRPTCWAPYCPGPSLPPCSGRLALGVLNKDGCLVMKEVQGGTALQARAVGEDFRMNGMQRLRGVRGKEGLAHPSWLWECLRLGGRACAWCHGDSCLYSQRSGE